MEEYFYYTCYRKSLPFSDNYFDIIIANHMLYHVKNINITLSEIRRVLKDTGLFFAATISKKNMKEIRHWIKKFSLNIDYNPKAKVMGISKNKNPLIVKDPFYP